MSEVVDTEVAVLGRGPAGCATAITLARAGVEVVLVAGPSHAPTNDYRPGEGAPPGTDATVRQVFGPDLDAFDATAHLRTYATRSAWGSDELATVDHMFNPFGPGWILDRAAFDARLLDAVRAAEVRVLDDATVVDSRCDAAWELTLARGSATDRVTAHYVCDASGRRAVVARAHGARVLHHDRLTAVACTLVDHSDAAPLITIEAGACGWWYTARLPGGKRVVAFFTDSDLVDVTQLLDVQAFASLAHTSEHVTLVADQVVGEPKIHPAGSRRLASPAGRRWLAVGDAAATFDPLSSQGIVTALLMGREAGWCALVACRGDAAERDVAEAAYVDCFQRVVSTYDREHADYYDQETRWPTHRFWSRRRSPQSRHAQAPSDIVSPA